MPIKADSAFPTYVRVVRSMLSKIERSETMPSAILLKKLAQALEVTLPGLAPPLPERTIIHIPRAQQPVFEDASSSFARRSLSPASPGPSIDWIEMTLPPNGKTQDIETHRRGLEEYIYVLEGQLAADIGGRLLTLETGDSLYFQADTKYSFENIGSAICRYFLVIDSSRVR
jgi:mannose-6-phosphate isomerase-like protein (cupin superfamily)